MINIKRKVLSVFIAGAVTLGGLSFVTPATAATVPGALGPTACNVISNPGTAQFFGAVNCYTFPVLMGVQFKGQTIVRYNVCVKAGQVLWEDNSAQKIGVGYLAAGVFKFGGPVRC